MEKDHYPQRVKRINMLTVALVAGVAACACWVALAWALAGLLHG